jgi:hypothetical protein
MYCNYAKLTFTHPFICFNISASMLRNMVSVLWSVLLGMELAKYFIQNQLYITSVSPCYKQYYSVHVVLK